MQLLSRQLGRGSSAVAQTPSRSAAVPARSTAAAPPATARARQQRAGSVAARAAARPEPQPQPARDVTARVAQLDAPAVQRGAARPAPKQHTYQLGELLGTGTAAHVHVGTHVLSGQQYAVKVLPKKKGSRDRQQLIRQEIAVAARLRDCRHAVRLVDSFEDERNIYVVQELCCGGDVADLMTAQEGQLSEAEAAAVIKCVLEFLADCHARRICYGDVKPNNFVLRSLYPSIAHLLDPSKPRGALEVVAVDFGCCQEVGEACLPDTINVTGTPLYMAPENLRGCHGMEVDVWAAGVMLYQLLSDQFPFWDVPLHELDSLGGAAIRDGILHGPLLFPLQPWATRVHPSARDLISRMLCRDAAGRITAAQALQHPWLAHALGGAEPAA